MAETIRRSRVDISWSTIFKLLTAAVLVWLWLTLVQLVLVVIVALLLAVTLNPVVEWFERRGLPRGGAAAAVGLLIIAIVAALLWLTWASLSEQAAYVAQRFRESEGDVLGILPAWVREAAGVKEGDTIQSVVAPYATRVGQSVVSAVVVTLLGFVLTLYLLIEARATREWVVAFVPKTYRGRIEQTLTECQRII